VGTSTNEHGENNSSGKSAATMMAAVKTTAAVAAAAVPPPPTSATSASLRGWQGSGGNRNSGSRSLGGYSRCSSGKGSSRSRVLHVLPPTHLVF